MDNSSSVATHPHIAIIGAGPAGLMAAEWLSHAGARVTIFDRMPSPARKFLLAGRGGLNLTHGEDLARFVSRYGEDGAWLERIIARCPPDAIRAWAEGLGEPTFVGSSGRVFPKSFKASPLLRAWLRRLDSAGVSFRFRSHWTGWNEKGQPLISEAGVSPHAIDADATVLALGGASWPRLGADGSWQAIFEAAGIGVRPLEVANAGVLITWSAHLIERFAGEPLKRISLQVGDLRVRGEAMVTRTGLEGGAVYAAFRTIREAIARGETTINLDLRPDLTLDELTSALGKAGPKVSIANRLRRAGLAPAAGGLMREVHGNALPVDAAALARLAKALPLTVTGVAGLERAISCAGGVLRTELGDDLMLTARPGTFVAGEMLDWEAPTGGYLLQACFATGAVAAQGAARRLGLPPVVPGWAERPMLNAE